MKTKRQHSKAPGRIIGWLGSTPVMIRGLSWFPAAQLAAFLGVFWFRKQRLPERSNIQTLVEAGLTSSVVLASEWAHNLAHLIASNAIRRPMDEFQILLGMPRCIYYDLNDAHTSPLQHIQRASAGPIFNASLLPLLNNLRLANTPGTLSRQLWDAAFGMNLFLATVSWLPIPGIDGGPILKWALVQQGRSPEAADEVVRVANGPLALLLGLGSGIAMLRRKRLLAWLLGLLGGAAMGVFLGLVREEQILQSPGSAKEGRM